MTAKVGDTIGFVKVTDPDNAGTDNMKQKHICQIINDDQQVFTITPEDNILKVSLSTFLFFALTLLWAFKPTAHHKIDFLLLTRAAGYEVFFRFTGAAFWPVRTMYIVQWLLSHKVIV